MKLKIIIIDDHAIVRKGLKQILTDEFLHVQVFEASSAGELYKLLRTDGYNMVITDISMPGQSGIEIIKQLHSQFPKLPILVLSMHPEEQYAIRAIKAGAMGYVTKDKASDELIKAVKDILNGKNYISLELTELLIKNLSSNSAPHTILSDRELKVLALLASGKTITGISKDLSLSVATVSTYRRRLLEKMGMKNNAELILYAVTNNLV